MIKSTITCRYTDEGQNGIELSKKIRKEDTMVKVLWPITAVSDYIGEGYDVCCNKLSIKPIKRKTIWMFG